MDAKDQILEAYDHYNASREPHEQYRGTEEKSFGAITDAAFQFINRLRQFVPGFGQLWENGDSDLKRRLLDQSQRFLQTYTVNVRSIPPRQPRLLRRSYTKRVTEEPSSV
jgi:hypothetical protein